MTLIKGIFVYKERNVAVIRFFLTLKEKFCFSFVISGMKREAGIDYSLIDTTTTLNQTINYPKFLSEMV